MVATDSNTVYSMIKSGSSPTLKVTLLKAKLNSDYLRVTEVPSYDSPYITSISYALFYSTANYNAYYVGFIDNYSSFSRLGFLLDLDDSNSCYSTHISWEDQSSYINDLAGFNPRTTGSISSATISSLFSLSSTTLTVQNIPAIFPNDCWPTPTITPASLPSKDYLVGSPSLIFSFSDFSIS